MLEQDMAIMMEERDIMTAVYGGTCKGRLHANPQTGWQGHR